MAGRDEWYEKANWKLNVPLDTQTYSQTTTEVVLNGFAFSLIISTELRKVTVCKVQNGKITYQSENALLPKVRLSCKSLDKSNYWEVEIFWNVSVLHTKGWGKPTSYCCQKEGWSEPYPCATLSGGESELELLHVHASGTSDIWHEWIQKSRLCLLVVSVSLINPLTKPVITFPLVTFSEPWNHSDVIFLVQGKEIHAHRQILSLHSPVFSTMLYGDFKERDSPTIQLPGKRHGDVIALLHLLYPEFKSFELDFRMALRLIGLFQEYQTGKLEDMARQVILDGTNTTNAFKSYAVGNEFGYEELKHKAVRTLSQLTTDQLRTRQPFVDADENFRTLIREARVFHLESEQL